MSTCVLKRCGSEGALGSGSYRAQLRIGRFPRIELLSAGSQQLNNSADRTFEYIKKMIFNSHSGIFVEPCIKENDPALLTRAQGHIFTEWNAHLRD